MNFFRLSLRSGPKDILRGGMEEASISTDLSETLVSFVIWGHSPPLQPLSASLPIVFVRRALPAFPSPMPAYQQYLCFSQVVTSFIWDISVFTFSALRCTRLSLASLVDELRRSSSPTLCAPLLSLPATTELY